LVLPIDLSVVDSDEYGNESSGFIKGGKFLEYPSEHQLLIKDFTPWSSGRSGFDSQQCKIFLFSTAPRLTLGPTQPPIQCTPVVLSPRVKQQGREADLSLQRSAEIKNGGVIPPLFHMSSWHRDKFTFYFLLNRVRCRSQRPRGLRLELSSPSRTLGSLVRIPL
jgi:hypothetical protein